MREINIDSPDGNAFALMGIAESFIKHLKEADIYTNNVDYDTVIPDMMSSDYQNLLDVFTRVFTYELGIAMLVNENGEEIQISDY